MNFGALLKPSTGLSFWMGLGLLTLLSSCAQYSKVSKVPVNALAVTAEQRELVKSVRKQAGDPTAKLGRYLDEADEARRKLAASPSDPGARSDYNFAVARVVEIIEDEKLTPWDAPVICPSEGGKARSLNFLPPDPRPEFHPSHFDIYPAERFAFKGTQIGERTPKPGLGAPVILTTKGIDHTEIDEFAQGKQIYYGMTALLDFEGDRCQLVLKDPLDDESVDLDQHSYPLAADFQAPLSLAVAELNMRNTELGRMFKPDEHTEDARIARLEPYDPDKIPVLFIHGLSNSPVTWVPMIHFLRNDERIRKNYQFWVYAYPSGHPYPKPTAVLRKKLDRIGERYPDHKDIVVVGHSMGGMISRLLISDSGDILWKTAFGESPEETELSAETRAAIGELLLFEARSDISRVIYCSASHRGSEDATNWLGRLGAKLIGDPLANSKITEETLSAMRAGTTARDRKRIPNSIDILDPDSPFLKAVDTLPPKPGIPYHSIIGDRGLGGNLNRTEPVSSDGTVPYWSSHLDGARSELIIPSEHWTIQHPEGMAEVRRILSLHLE